MKRLINSFIIAFSMYSKIPMPRCDWSENNMAYAMCFWLLGGRRHRRPVLAVGSDRSSCNHESGLFYRYTAPDLCICHRGIHLDGLLDTADAMSSYQERERRLEILKDSHAGAFAVITCVVYSLL